jgi:hypothetical protein
MKYRVTVLTPTLVGNGDKLSPIDYMVWRDQVNVLDQPRIFKLLSKGPRLEGYLTQLHRATKLDFASWGGFAQNYADRRIPFEDATYTPYWERAQAESLSIPTFAATREGPFLPGAAIKGALRTAFVFANLKLLAKLTGEHPSRHPAQHIEQQASFRWPIPGRGRAILFACTCCGSLLSSPKDRSNILWDGSSRAEARWKESALKMVRRHSRRWPIPGLRLKGSGARTNF